LQQFAERAGTQPVAATIEKKFNPRKPKGAPLDAACSEKPTGAVHWCELKRGGAIEKFDHCYPRGGVQFWCFANPYSPGVLVKRVAEASGFMPEDPWAVELESGDVCTRSTHPVSWTCNRGTRIGVVPPSKDNPWMVMLPTDELMAVKAIYR
jgi:hypothetical protein